MQKKSVIIIGAGQAAAACAVELRAHGFDGRILIIGDETHMPYERPELSKKIANGQKTLEDVTILDAEKAAEKDIEVLVGTTVHSVDRARREVKTADAVFTYDVLVFATGGRARSLPQADVIGLPVVSIRTLEDSEQLKALMASSGSVVVIGGGWLGLEAAATCKEAGLTVTLLEMADRLCARVAPPALSEDLLELHIANGVEVLLGETVAFKPGGLETATGHDIKPDFIVVAIGMEANDTLASGAGLETDRGILVDPDFCTSDPTVFAIGDCAAVRQVDGTALRSESWQNANQSAAYVAAIICEGEPRAKAPDWFWSDQFDSNIQMIGGFGDADRALVQTSGGGKTVLQLIGDRLCGAYAINAPREIAKCRRRLTTDKVHLAEKADGIVDFVA